MKNNKFKQIKWSRLFLNKYFIATIIFAIIFFFIDQDNVLRLKRMFNQSNSLKKEIRKEQELFSNDSALLDSLKIPEFRERYAREKYFFKQKNEDVFIIEENND